MSRERASQQIPKRPYEIFGFNKKERLYWRVNHEHLGEILDDEQTIVHKVLESSNTFGEFLFVTASRPGDQGRVVKETARKGQSLLTALLDADAGSRYLGEWGIGTNYQIRRFTKNMLFDEKMGGTIHLALGAGLPQAGGQNKSSIHWDMLCDMSESEILVDGDLFYKDGKFAV